MAIIKVYPGIKRGKRGDKLGRLYTKKGLEEAFQKNDELFRSRPELRAQVAGKVQAVASGAESLKEKKDYTKFTKIGRGGEKSPYPFEKEIGGDMLPFDELYRARKGSIFEYCKRNKLELAQNDKGQPLCEFLERPQLQP